MEATIKTNGMHCDGCRMLIEDVIGEEVGVISVNADYKANEVKVVFDEEKIALNRIKKIISDEGYGKK